MQGGAVATRLERIDVTVSGSSGNERTLRLVRKWTWKHEVLGLRAAQAVVDQAPAIPVLVAEGEDVNGPWLVTPFHAGAPVPKGAIPETVFESLALLHARYVDDWVNLAGIPVVDPDWWRFICLSYAMSEVDKQAALSPNVVLDRARTVLNAMADDGRIVEILGQLPRTLLHGDVHPGNILVGADESTLVDWGSARVGPAMLDLANVTDVGSPQFSAYAQAWEDSTHQPLGAALVELGYLWAAVQIPIQYLAWVASSRSPEDVAVTLDRAEAGLAALPAR
jgi:aminoglycoside phosphotransferase (APT) family kinase protein